MGDPTVVSETEWKAMTEELFGQYETAYIVGKGPTFRDPMPKNKNDKTFILGINEAVNRIQHPTAVMVQDVHLWNNITSMQKLEYCIMPLYSITKGKYSTDFTPNMLLGTLNLYGFNGSLLPYGNLHSENYKHLDHKNGEDETMVKFCSTGYQGCGFVRSFLPNIKKVVTYGIARKPQNDLAYHNHFRRTGTSSATKYGNDGFYRISRLLIQEIFKNTDIKLEIR